MQVTKEVERLFIENEVKHGAKNQIIVCIEEMSELTKELSKFIRTDADHDLSCIAEEMADVEICLMMLRVMLENGDEVDKWIERKLHRIKERLGE